MCCLRERTEKDLFSHSPGRRSETLTEEGFILKGFNGSRMSEPCTLTARRRTVGQQWYRLLGRRLKETFNVTRWTLRFWSIDSRTHVALLYVHRMQESGGTIYINPQETDLQAGPSIMVGTGTVGLWVDILHRLMHRMWWGGGYCNSFWETNHRCVAGYMRIQTLFFLSLFQPQVAHPPYTTHHLFLGTSVSYMWLSSGAVHCGVGVVADDVCAACSIPEQGGQFTQAAQLLSVYFFINVHSFSAWVKVQAVVGWRRRWNMEGTFNGFNGRSALMGTCRTVISVIPASVIRLKVLKHVFYASTWLKVIVNLIWKLLRDLEMCKSDKE